VFLTAAAENRVPVAGPGSKQIHHVYKWERFSIADYHAKQYHNAF
jgi:hypothetical protein